MKKAKIWLEKKGLKHVGLVIAAIALWLFLPGFFNSIGLVLLGIFIGLNWDSLKDLSEVDEFVEEKLSEAKKELQEQIDEIKRKLVNLKK